MPEVSHRLDTPTQGDTDLIFGEIRKSSDVFYELSGRIVLPRLMGYLNIQLDRYGNRSPGLSPDMKAIEFLRRLCGDDSKRYPLFNLTLFVRKDAAYGSTTDFEAFCDLAFADSYKRTDV
jgi:hypothetical protein